jgi:eukaryotic-like serine/threonine-protein kinase
MGIMKKHPAVFLGIGITVLFLLLALIKVDFIDALELKLYDVRMNLRGGGGTSDAIVLVDIDNDSIEKMGRWPWPRSRIAQGIDKIDAAGARIIGLNIIYSEPQESSALKELTYLTEMLAQTAKDPQVLKAMQEARQRLDHDRQLAGALRAAGNAVLPIFFKQSLVAENARENALSLKDETLRNVDAPEDATAPEGGKIVMPIPPFREAAMGLGHVNLFYDVDGKARREQLLYRYGGLYFPSFTLKIAALYQDVLQKNISATLGESVTLGLTEMPVTRKTEFLVSFKEGEAPFKRYSFFDVVADKIPASVFKDRIVLITPSASGIMNPLSTPAANVMSVGEFTAHVIWSMLNKQFIRKPGWNATATYAMILILGLVIAFLMPRLRALAGGIVFAGLLILMVGGAIYMFTAQGLWIEVAYPLIQLIIGYIGVATLSFFVAEARKEKVEEQSAETNRMLGISFQSQGMLDMAFDKFRRAPVDAEMKDVLYGLGKDYERKRQFTKAASVYEYIEQHDPKYKDVARRKKKLVEASETMIFGDGFLTGAASSDDLLSAGGDTKPTLGRYEVSKQLGKGAMGVVYLGQDPRINRTTAIKTFKFSEDYEPEEAEKMKAKFFREAESAGTLSHPNIVTIYDAGDEQDLAYIAMEYLEGEDLQKYTKKSNLLPIRKVIEYVADIADGLDYAHEKGVVHRDIKPANVMLLKSGIIKITDFGIARITADSQTQTGVVKGTPHYMSPEQISGEKVDGRSDVFSLGAMMFQMLTGTVPFKGDSPAALMHQIMNTPHPNPREINPRVIKPLTTIIDKALEKDREKRYQRASHMAAHLRTLGKKIDAHAAQKKKKAAGA